MKHCLIEGCDNEISATSQLECCATCRGSFSYWRRKRPAQLLARRTALRKYQDRLNYLKENFRGQKVEQRSQGTKPRTNHRAEGRANVS